MSLLNVSLQSVGIRLDKMCEGSEEFIKKPTQWMMSRKLHWRRNFKEEFISSMSAPVELIKCMFGHLEIKGVPVNDEEIKNLIAKSVLVDSSAKMSDTYSRNFKESKKPSKTLLCSKTIFLSFYSQVWCNRLCLQLLLMLQYVVSAKIKVHIRRLSPIEFRNLTCTKQNVFTCVVELSFWKILNKPRFAVWKQL